MIISLLSFIIIIKVALTVTHQLCHRWPKHHTLWVCETNFSTIMFWVATGNRPRVDRKVSYLWSNVGSSVKNIKDLDFISWKWPSWREFSWYVTVKCIFIITLSFEFRYTSFGLDHLNLEICNWTWRRLDEK